MKGLRVAVIGATGNVGRALTAALLAQGAEVTAIARTVSWLQGLGEGVHPVAVDVEGGADQLRAALAGADCVINAAHARFTSVILAALPDRRAYLVTLGSTRKFTRFPDEKAAQVMAAEAAHREYGNGIILHPTMIYGGADNNISRVLKFTRWAPVIALPNRGKALLQPIHRDDVVRCVLAAIEKSVTGAPIIIAGAQPLDYAQLIRVCAHAAGRSVRVVSAPLWGIQALAWLTNFVPGVPAIGGDEVRRLLEDKAFVVAPMQARLGVMPCTLQEGLARMAVAGEIPGRHAV